MPRHEAFGDSSQGVLLRLYYWREAASLLPVLHILLSPFVFTPPCTAAACMLARFVSCCLRRSAHCYPSAMHPQGYSLQLEEDPEASWQQQQQQQQQQVSPVGVHMPKVLPFAIDSGTCGPQQCWLHLRPSYTSPHVLQL